MNREEAIKSRKLIEKALGSDIAAMLISKVIKISESLHYPECWDTEAYPTVFDAVFEVLATSKCSVCADPEAHGVAK